MSADRRAQTPQPVKHPVSPDIPIHGTATGSDFADKLGEPRNPELDQFIVDRAQKQLIPRHNERLTNKAPQLTKAGQNMSEVPTYPAAEVDANVNLMAAGASELIREKQASDMRVSELEAENRTLREKLAKAPQVELEKVAQAPFSFSSHDVRATVDALTEKNIIVPEAKQSTMEKLASDPGYALKMLQHFANFNVEPLVRPRGGGVDTTPKTVKSASAGRDDDWFEEPAAGA